MASSSSSSQLQISLEAPPPDRDPITNRPLILYDYAEGGVPIWKQEESSEEILGKTIRRVWEEKGGLVNFTQQELSDKITREQEQEHGDDDEQLLPEDSLAVVQEMEDSLPSHREIDPEEMKVFKFQIAERLQQASHALEHFSIILALLLPSAISQTPAHTLPAGVPFPPSSLSTTHTLPIPPTPTPTAALDSLAEKQRSLRETADLFKRSGEELKEVVKRAEGEWKVALGVREVGGWAVGLRGAERGFMGDTSGKRDARDWVGWYGLDAAPPAFRMRYYAHLPAPDAPSSSSSSSTSQPKLVFPNRTRRRLQVTVSITVDGFTTSSSSECLARPTSLSEGGDGEEEVDGGKEAAREMEEAMWEAVEEETFAEVIAEARQLVQTLPSRIAHNSIKIEVSPGLELAISLIIPTSSPSPPSPSSPSSSSSSAYPTLLSSYLTLSLLSLHSHRSTHLALASQPVRDPRALSSSNPNSARPKILQPVVEVVQFKGLEKRVRSLVAGLVEGLGCAASGKGKEREGSVIKGGLGMKVRVEWEGEEGSGWEPVETGGRSGVKVREEGRKGVLWLEDCLPVTLQILPPLRLNLLVPNRSPSSSSSSNPSQLNPKTNTVTITDLVHLASLLELEVKDVILKKLAGIAKEDVETKGATEGFVDRLQGVALLQWEKGEVRFEPLVTLTTSTFHPSLYIRAMVRSISDPDGKEVVFESHGNGSGKGEGGGVWEWARGVWIGARSKST